MRKYAREARLSELVVLTCIFAAAHGCMSLINGWKPLSPELRASSEGANIVIIGYVNRTFKSERYLLKEPDFKQYTAELIVLDVLKDDMDIVKSKRVLNVSNFGRREDCYSDVRMHRVYVIFMTYRQRRFWAIYDDIYGAAEEYSRELEIRLQNALGITDWSAWSACSAKCGGGVQVRERRCVSCGNWSETQTRTCNLFSCSVAYQQLCNSSIDISDKVYDGLSVSVNDTILGAQFRLTNFTIMMTLVLNKDIQKVVPGVHLFTIEDGKARPKLAVVLRNEYLHIWSAKRNKLQTASNASSRTGDRIMLPSALFDDHSHALAMSIVGKEFVLNVDALYTIRQPLTSSFALKLPKKNIVSWRVYVGQLAFDSPLGNGERGKINVRHRRRLSASSGSGSSRILGQISNVVISTNVVNASMYVTVPLTNQTSIRMMPANKSYQGAKRTSQSPAKLLRTTASPLNGFNWLQAEQKPLRGVKQLSTERPRTVQHQRTSPRTSLSDTFMVVEDSWCSPNVPGAQTFRLLEPEQAPYSVCRNGASCIIVDRLSYFQVMCLCPPGYSGLYCHLRLSDEQNAATANSTAAHR